MMLLVQLTRGDIIILITNNRSIPFEFNAGQRIAQIVFHKKEEAVFKKVKCLDRTERGTGGFGSTGL